MVQSGFPEAKQIFLSVVKPGEKFVIIGYSGGVNLHMRLLNMGLRIGDKIEVISNSGHGQLVIAVDYTRMVLGRGVAEKILGVRETK